jgi:hypothetical protein
VSDSTLTPKQKRTVQRDVETLFSPKAFVVKPTLENIQRFGVFHPTVRYKRGIHFLSDRGVMALRRLTGIICGMKSLRDSVSEREIGAQVLQCYNDLLEKHLQPTGEELVENVVASLIDTVKNYEFLIQLEGLDLKDQDVLELGAVRLQRADRASLEKVKFDGGLTPDSIYEQLKDSLWLTAAVTGSPDVALAEFEYRATIAVGLLALCGAILYEGGLRRSRVRAVISPLEHRKAIVMLRWDRGGDNPQLTRKWGFEQDLPLDSETVAHLTRHCFLKDLAALPAQANRTELQDAILRSVYWFADAHKDSNPTMQFVKLWSCAECFFAIDKVDVTDVIAKGFTTILTFAGYKIVELADYPSFKRRVEKLYDLRSKAIHRGFFGHVGMKDLDDFSRWIGWIIISMFALSKRGYSTLRQVQEQTLRLDRVADKTTGEKN